MKNVLWLIAGLLFGGCTVMPAAPVSTACPQGKVLVVSISSLALLPEGLRRDALVLIEAAQRRNSLGGLDSGAYALQDVSRTLGPRLRIESPRPPVNLEVEVRLLDPKDASRGETIGRVHVVNGVGQMPLVGEQCGTIELIFPSERFLSPTVSNGARRLRISSQELAAEGLVVNTNGLIQ